MDDLLEIAMQRNNTEIIEKLLTFGASPLKQVNDLSPVIHAIQERNCPLLDRLLQCVSNASFDEHKFDEELSEAINSGDPLL